VGPSLLALPGHAAEVRLDLAGVPVGARHLVGACVLVELRVVEAEVGGAAGARDAGDDGGDRMGAQQAGGRERRERQRRGGGVAAGAGDDGGAWELGAVELREARRRLREPLGARVVPYQVR
jgi:hypothetical protein